MNQEQKINRRHFQDLKQCNELFIEYINGNKPFSIVRVGSNEMNLLLGKPNYVQLGAVAGINFVEKGDIDEYKKAYTNAIAKSDVFAKFYSWACVSVPVQDGLIKSHNLESVHSRTVEPFHIVQNKDAGRPWSQYLFGKKVLIISHFVESFKKQVESGFQIFPEEENRIFMDGQDFVFYKTKNTAGCNNTYGSWKNTYKIMCDEIKNIEFDIALISCGGYGLLLCDFIKSEMNKSSIYVGGGLQLLFGVMGKRWDGREPWTSIKKKYNPKFIRPSGEEIIKGIQLVECGAYW